MNHERGNRFEVLREGETSLWFIVEENAQGWYVGSAAMTKPQVQRRRRILTKDFGMVEIRVARFGNGFVAAEVIEPGKERCLGLVYTEEADCRTAHKLMDFSAMGRYAPKERKSSTVVLTRFERLNLRDVV